jgi:hypothetical protein
MFTRVLPKVWLIYFISLPFIYSPASYETFALRKSIFLILLSFNLFCWPFVKKPNEINIRPLDIFPVLYLIFRILSVFHSGNAGEFQLCLEPLLFEGALVLFFMMRLGFNFPISFLNKATRGIIFSSGIVSLLQLMKADFIKPILDGRLSAQFFHPNVAGIIIASCVAFIFFEPKSKAKYFWCGAGLLIILGTASKTALITLFIVLILFDKGKRRLAYLGVLLLLGIWLLLKPQPKIEKLRNNPSHSLSIRKMAYSSVLTGIKENPLGVGPGMFHLKIHPYVDEKFHEFFPNPTLHSLNKAHNFILEVTFESGIHFLILAVFFIFYLFKSKQTQNKVALSVLIIASMFSVHLNYPTSQIIFVLFLLPYASEEEETT